jgi:hypothetical protein
MSFYAECLKISPRPRMQRISRLEASSQRWTSPRVLRLKNPRWKFQSPQVHEMPKVTQVLRVLHLLQSSSTQDMTLLMIHPTQIRSNTQEHPHRTPNHMDSGLLVVVKPAKVHSYPSPEMSYPGSKKQNQSLYTCA